MKKNIFFLLLNLNLILNLSSCNTTDPKLEPDLKLELKDVSCTEAWIQLTTKNIQLPATINLLENNSVTQTFSLSTQDSLLYIDSLLPNQTYKFKVVINTTNNPQQTTNEVLIQTMDTTSHNFTWQTFEFGQHSSSVLYDVAIIDENNIWAVGAIYMNDSLGNPDPNFYNLVKWDGTDWKPERIYFTNSQGQSFLAPMKSIFAFNINDIWIGLDQLIHWDGNDYVEYELLDTIFPSWINKIWGTSSNDFYIVGNSGNIAHYNGSSWTRVESGTDLDFKDVCGTVERSEIFISGYSTDLSKSILLKLTNNNIEAIWENNTISSSPPYGNIIYSLVGYRNNLFISSDLGVFKQEFTTNNLVQKLFTVPRRVYKIAGTYINDIYTVGDRSNVWHYNGVSKKELYVNLSVSSPFYSAAVKENTIVAVGTTVENVIFHLATLIIGRRN